jgi:gp16 family phage-associated protein
MTKTSSNQIKHELRKRGFTLKAWAESNGFKYRDVSDVVRGVRKGNYGVGRDICEKLGIPVDGDRLAA